MPNNLPKYGLLPFIQDYYPAGHHLQQDNDLKHASHYIKQFFENHGVDCTW